MPLVVTGEIAGPKDLVIYDAVMHNSAVIACVVGCRATGRMAIWPRAAFYRILFEAALRLAFVDWLEFVSDSH